MNNEKRELYDIKNDLKIIKSNKLSISQSKFLFMGIIYEILFNKELFPKNKDLKDFVNNQLLILFNQNEPYKDYIFKTRTTLASKIQRYIYLHLEYSSILDIVNEIDKILFADITSTENHKSKVKDTNNDLDEWMDFLNKKDN